MQHGEYVQALRSHSARFARVARDAALDLPVPTCPPWTLERLVGHLGSHYRWVEGNLDRMPDDGVLPVDAVEDAPPGAAVVEWLERGAESLAQKLTSVGHDWACWTWTDQKVSGFWARRTAHETAIHGWDGLNSCGVPAEIDADLAADGIDEFIALLPFRWWTDPPRGDGERIVFVCDDVAAEWVIRLEPSGMSRAGRGEGDVVVRGGASELFLSLLGRRPASAVEISGDRALPQRWQAAAAF